MDYELFFDSYEHQFDFGEIVNKLSDRWEFKCPLDGCEDRLSSDPFELRGHLQFEKGFYHCFRCGATLSIKSFIEELRPELIKDFYRFNYQQNKTFQVTITPTKQITKKIVIDEDVLDFQPPSYFGFTEIDNFEIEDYLVERGLNPKDFLYDKTFHRIVVPYYNEDKSKLYYYQLRSILKTAKNKYIFDKERNINDEKSYRSIFNLYGIDKSKPVVLFEGALDSMFFENAVGNSSIGNFDTNIDFIVEFGVKKENLKLLLDFDIAGFETLLKFAKQFYVFDWLSFLKDFNMMKYISRCEKVDMNDIYMCLNRDKKFSYNELAKYFVKSNRLLEAKYKSVIIKFKKQKRELKELKKF